MSFSANARAVRRVLFLLAFLVFAAHASMPAAAVTCGLSYDAPTGGGAFGPPITAQGRIACAGTPGGGSEFSVYLSKDNVTVTSARQSMVGRTSATLNLMASCSPGNWSITVAATIPGATVSPPFATSPAVFIDCGGGGGAGPFSDSPTMTLGFLQTPNNFYVGFLQGAFGSMSPGNTINGKTYRNFMDNFGCSPFGCFLIGSSLTVSGFTSDPGIGWLISTTAMGTTRMGSTAAYSYDSASGQASWVWNGQAFGFSGVGTAPVIVVHQ